MVSEKQVRAWLDEILKNVPGEFTQDLAGGVSLLGGARVNPALPDEGQYIVSEYVGSNIFGCRILIYYGSLTARYPDSEEEELKNVLREELFRQLKRHMRRVPNDEVSLGDLFAEVSG